mmetsp:Transcript_2668/g.10217  ORF Transcript_2668/g.10217 Transcript_2668/m.10217 type:complete len:251 (-) Transcript_2668:1712-2464(-)
MASCIKIWAVAPAWRHSRNGAMSISVPGPSSASVTATPSFRTADDVARLANQAKGVGNGCVAQWWSSAVSSCHVGQPDWIFTAPDISMSLNARKRRAQTTTGCVGARDRARIPGHMKVHRNPTSRSKISHWNDKNVCPTTNIERYSTKSDPHTTAMPPANAETASIAAHAESVNPSRQIASAHASTLKPSASWNHNRVGSVHARSTRVSFPPVRLRVASAARPSNASDGSTPRDPRRPGKSAYRLQNAAK